MAAAVVSAAGVVAGLAYYRVVTGKLTIDLGWGRRLRPLGPFGVEIAGPVTTVFHVGYTPRNPPTMRSGCLPCRELVSRVCRRCLALVDCCESFLSAGFAGEDPTSRPQSH